MNVLSLFDGMSCGQVALDRTGIEYENYFASEIDKWAIKIAQKNYPNTIQLGDITKWREWNLPYIDLLIGGSPCQGFSNAGAGLNFDDPRSKLFFDYVDILRHYKPKWFLLENVKMKKEWRDVITQYMGVEPIEINSALVSAQNRKRLYWTNIPNIQQPEDKHIYLRNIIDDGEVDREKSYTIDANYYKGGNPRSYFEDGKRQLVFEHQSQKRAMVKVGNVYPSGGQNGNVYKTDGKSPPLSAGIGIKGRCIGSSNSPKILLDDYQWRKLTVTECERLQTVPHGYTDGVSNTQRYKMLGNGWTIDVIAHIFKYIPMLLGKI
jgi:DNA-cytosine methyltransferase